MTQNEAKDEAKIDRTELVFILDRSGSMGGLESDTIGGFNATLAKHREANAAAAEVAEAGKGGAEANVTTVLFDDKIERLHDRVPIEAVEKLTEKEYFVRGCTALLDAIGSTIKHVDSIQHYQPEGYKADHVIFVITTDGLENASREFSRSQVKKLIEQHQEMGWEFFFLGANIDAVGEAASIGIAEDRAVTYLADSEGTDVMFEAVGCATMGARKCARGSRIGRGWKNSVEKDVASRGR